MRLITPSERFIEMIICFKYHQALYRYKESIGAPLTGTRNGLPSRICTTCHTVRPITNKTDTDGKTCTSCFTTHEPDFIKSYTPHCTMCGALLLCRLCRCRSQRIHNHKRETRLQYDLYPHLSEQDNGSGKRKRG